MQTKDFEPWRQTDVSSNPSYASHQLCNLGMPCNLSEPWLSPWLKEQLQCRLPEWMIRTHLFLWATEKFSDQLSKAVLASGHVLGSAGPCSGHTVISTVVTVVLTGQGLHSWLGL